MLDKVLDFLLDALTLGFLPLVNMYQIICADMVFNVADEKAVGIERVANELLSPYHFIFCGRKASLKEDGYWLLEQRFPTDSYFWVKMGFSITSLPSSVILGGSLKMLSLLSSETREKIAAIRRSYSWEGLSSQREKYISMGLPLGNSKDFKFATPQGYLREEGVENHLGEEKSALQEVTQRLTEAGIVWWVDCGTCLGAYRYGGVIPWDTDVDIAFLLPDYDNVLCALSTLDPLKYVVQDWSSRDFPKTYLKVILKKNNSLIDLYFFDIHPEKKEVQYFLSLENHTFLPESWQIREKRFTVPTPFDVVFPLKKGIFDGVEVFLPNNTEKYLQLRYGENLAPAKLYNPATKTYEKDLSHPYWQRSYVH